MRKSILLTIVCFLATTAVAGDLYKVTLNSQKDAEKLNATDVEVLLWADGGYLVYIEDSQREGLRRTGLIAELLASSIQRDRLALERAPDQAYGGTSGVLYEDEQIRLVQVDESGMIDPSVQIVPVVDRQFPLKYNGPPPRAFFELPFAADGLDTIVAKVDQGMLEWYIDTLVSGGHRLTGTIPNERMRYFMLLELLSYGYDSIYIDPFTGIQLWDRIACNSYNVVATKVGSVYPDKQIVIAGHFDSVPDCPGADDNGTGTAAVLEMARILMGLETQMTMVFIAFDSEESWMIGSYHYVDEAIARGDDIVLMVNLDMMGHETNNTEAIAYYGLQPAYATLWAQMAAEYGGMTTDTIAYMISDCLPFHEAGYDAIWLHEKEFSNNYHDPTDIPEHLNFDYLTRVVKATLATVYTVDRCLPRLDIVLVEDPGDGQSQVIHWESAVEPSIQGYRLSYFPVSDPDAVTSVDVPALDTSGLVAGLTEDVEYGFYVQAIDSEGYLSLPSVCANGTPHSEPQPPPHVVTIPELEAVRISWQYEQTELDFDHSRVIRDGEVIADLNDTFYVDTDPSLGSAWHDYYIVACDQDGYHSDTTEFDPVQGKAATLQADRILAVNRSCEAMSSFYVDAQETGSFLHEALDGYNFDYFSDTLAIMPTFTGDVLDLVEMVDYELVIVGAETGPSDEIGRSPEGNGILDTLVYYMSLGGKVILFGRWGHIGPTDTVDYLADAYSFNDAYRDIFHIDYRVRTYSEGPYYPEYVFRCDLIGAESNDADYPTLAWDSLATVGHTGEDVEGIPYASFINVLSGEASVMYTYDSRHDDLNNEGKPVAWQYLGADYQYVCFDIPLSFFEREPAKAALRQAVDDLLNYVTDVEEPVTDHGLPRAVTLSQNYPNPFNPATEMVYSLLQRSHVTLSVYNVLGRRVTTLVDADQPAGTHRVLWNGTDDNGNVVATGIYLYRLQAGDRVLSKKMLLLK